MLWISRDAWLIERLFEGVLNVESFFNVVTIESTQPMVVREEIFDPPTDDEVVAALSRKGSRQY